jgi:ABC-type sugar transport system permease subunit
VKLSLKTQRTLYGYVFVAPWLIGFLVLLAWPLLFALWISFREVRELSPLNTVPVGYANYQEAFVKDIRFLPRFWQTLGNLLVDLPIILVFSLGVALLVHRPLPGRTFFRAVFFMPVVIGSAWVIQSLVGQGVGRLAIVRDIGELRELLGLYVGEGAITPLFDLLNRITFVLWRSGVQILIFIAGLHSVPAPMYEAARVDGASEWSAFWKITLPMIAPFLLVNVIYTIVDSFTEPFNQVLVYIQQVALVQSVRLGYGAALGWIYFVAVFLILAVVLIWSSRLIYYAGER